MATQIATEEIGAVNAIPTRTETMIHIRRGTTSKLSWMSLPIPKVT